MRHLVTALAALALGAPTAAEMKQAEPGHYLCAAPAGYAQNQDIVPLQVGEQLRLRVRLNKENFDPRWTVSAAVEFEAKNGRRSVVIGKARDEKAIDWAPHLSVEPLRPIRLGYKRIQDTIRFIQNRKSRHSTSRHDVVTSSVDAITRPPDSRSGIAHSPSNALSEFLALPDVNDRTVCVMSNEVGSCWVVYGVSDAVKATGRRVRLYVK
jgi:hypothetical protein